MDLQSLVDRVQELAGFAAPAEAERATSMVVRTLGEALAPADARAFAAALPQKLRGEAVHAAFGADLDRATLFAHVASREHVARGFGVEHTQAVCHALAEQLDPHALAHLRAAL